MSALAKALRVVATHARDAAWEMQAAIDTGDVAEMKQQSVQAARLAADLARVLAHVVDGMDVRRAFGAPGDWGYDTPIGEGVIELLNASLPTPTATK